MARIAAGMSLRIGLAINPRSRYLRRHPGAAGRLAGLLDGRGVAVETRSLDEVDANIARFRDAEVDVIGVVGGDGTAGILIDGLAKAYPNGSMPPLALLRGGTMNTVANGMGLPRGKPEKLLAALLARTANGALPVTEHRPTLVADGRVGFLFGTGVFRGFLETYYDAGKDDPNVVTAAETMSRITASAIVQGPLIKRVTAPLTATVEVDGEVWPEDSYMALTAGVVAQVGLGFRPFYKTNRYRRGFHFLALHGTAGQVVRSLWRVAAGRPLPTHVARDRMAHEVIIRPSAPEVGYMVDGDLYTCPGPLTIRSGPVVRIIR